MEIMPEAFKPKSCCPTIMAPDNASGLMRRKVVFTLRRDGWVGGRGGGGAQYLPL